MTSALESYFQVRQAGSTLRREALAGVTTFLAMAYIVFVNPAILSQAGMDFGAVFTATCLSAAIATLIMALFANYPIALAPGMGQNLFFLTLVTSGAATWQQALGAVFIAGLVFLALTLTRVRSLLIEAIPGSLKTGLSVGIGLFITFIGMINAGLLTRQPDGAIRLGDLFTAPPMLAFAGFVVTAGLMARRQPAALLWGIGASTTLALVSGLLRFEGVVGEPPSLAPTLLKMDLAGVLTLSMAPVVLVFLYVALFDAVGTLVAVGQRAGLVKDGKLIRGERALAADAAGTMVGAALGTSTVTAYVESAAGVEAGGRTGLAGLVTAGLFGLTLFAAPLVRMVGGGIQTPAGAPLFPLTAPALILVGALMTRGVLSGGSGISWDDPTEALPAFLVMAGIPFSFSIADGLAIGFIAYPCLKVAAGRWREVGWPMYALSAMFVARYFFLR
ncbi:MAG TPA: NCS2 family permease [Patescibacteria group bacterium]|nr:NCS2 family permease [Patescibacteria group bacterium]